VGSGGGVVCLRAEAGCIRVRALARMGYTLLAMVMNRVDMELSKVNEINGISVCDIQLHWDIALFSVESVCKRPCHWLFNTQICKYL
jgi:hypothetical protein